MRQTDRAVSANDNRVGGQGRQLLLGGEYRAEVGSHPKPVGGCSSSQTRHQY